MKTRERVPSPSSPIFYYIHDGECDVIVDPFKVTTFVVGTYPLHLHYFAMSGTLKDGKVNLSFNGTRGCEVIFRKEFRYQLIQTSGAFSTVLLVMIKYRSTISTHFVDFNKMGLGTQEDLDKLAQLLTTTTWSQ